MEFLKQGEIIMISKSTGIVRETNKQGRIVLPREMRIMLEIEIQDPLEFFIDGDKIILKKHTPDKKCAITGEVTARNIKVGNGTITLSPKGARLLVKELKNVLVY